MKGIKLARKYYEEYGAPMIHEKFGEYEKYIAVGLVGQGSECFMYDDILSSDHDFGPGFCMWLSDMDYDRIGEDLTTAFDELPKEFMGYKRLETSRAGHRIGVFSIKDFYEQFTGCRDIPDNLLSWLRIPERMLATATNGQVFRDDYGEFTRIRNGLLEFYPEDVRIKKIAARAASMAQAGQYNYSRCMKRGDVVSASIAINEFVVSTMAMVYLLNKKYAPYYKWMHRGLENLSVLRDISEKLKSLVLIENQSVNWRGLDEVSFLYGVNIKDAKVKMIEEICEEVLEELVKQGLCESGDPFLEFHVDEIIARIKDNKLRMMHVLDA